MYLVIGLSLILLKRPLRGSLISFCCPVSYATSTIPHTSSMSDRTSMEHIPKWPTKDTTHLHLL